MRKKTAAEIAQAVVQNYFENNTCAPTVWTDLFDDYQEREDIKGQVDQSLAEYEEMCDQLLEQLMISLPEEVQQEWLADLDTTWQGWRMAESEFVFLLGIAVGKRLALN